MGLFSALGQISSALQPIADQQNARSEDQFMLRLLAANPTIGQAYAGYTNNVQANATDKRRTALLERQSALEEQAFQRQIQQQEALKQLAMQNLSPQDLITRGAAITGDIGSLSSLAAAREGKEVDLMKLKMEQQKQAAIANLFGSGPMGQPVISPQASGPLNVRNNNPGNMRGPSGAFQSFESPQAGLEAMRKDLNAKIMGQSNAMKAAAERGMIPNTMPTLSNVITTWAPPTENDTGKYIDFVSRETGFAPDKVLETTDIDRLIPAMVKMEGGQQASNYYAQANPALAKLQQAAMIDEASYGPSYLSALATDSNQQYQRQKDALERSDKLAEQEREQKTEEEKKNREAELKLTEGESALRKEFEGLPDIKEFRQIEGAYKRIAKAKGKDSAAGDIALVYNFMKMQDPGSTVREGEYATAQNAAGIPDRIQAMYNNAIDGQRLSPTQRNDFFNVAERQYLGAEELFNSRADEYENLAKSYKYEPKRIVQRARQKIEKTAATGGIKFLGFE